MVSVFVSCEPHLKFQCDFERYLANSFPDAATNRSLVTLKLIPLLEPRLAASLRYSAAPPAEIVNFRPALLRETTDYSI